MDEFLKALAEFNPIVSTHIEYRVYYDPESGEILNYTNEHLPGHYITVDRETFACHRFDCRIKEGKLVHYRVPLTKMVAGETGTACHPTDITVLAEPGYPAKHWKLKVYEQD